MDRRPWGLAPIAVACAVLMGGCSLFASRPSMDFESGSARLEVSRSGGRPSSVASDMTLVESVASTEGSKALSLTYEGDDGWVVIVETTMSPTGTDRLVVTRLEPGDAWPGRFARGTVRAECRELERARKADEVRGRYACIDMHGDGGPLDAEISYSASRQQPSHLQN